MNQLFYQYAKYQQEERRRSRWRKVALVSWTLAAFFVGVVIGRIV